VSTTISVPGSTTEDLDRLDATSPESEDLRTGSGPRSWRPVAGCLVAYVVLAVLAFFPVGPFDTTRLPAAGGGNPAGNDPFQMTWFLTYIPYALTHGLSLFHSNYIDYPTGINLADNTSVPLLGIFAWPITATLGPVAAFNFLIRFSLAISGASMFLVLRRWCSAWQAAFVGGLLYAFGPYMAAQALHIDLTFVPIPPLLLLFGDELVRRQRMSPWRLGLLIGLVSTVQLLTSPDIISGCFAMALVIGLGLAIRFRHLLRERIGYILKASVLAVGSFGLLSAYPVYEMLFGPGSISGPVVPVRLLQDARADLLGALVPNSNQLFVPRFISFIGDYFVGGNLSENGTFIGIPLLVVLFIVFRRFRADATVVVSACGLVLAWLLSLGSTLVIGTWASPVALPGDLLAHLPLFDNTIPARYALYVLLFASLLVAIGLDRLWLPQLANFPALGTTTWERLKGLSKKQKQLLAIGSLVAVSLVPNVPFASKLNPWPASLPSTIESVVAPGSVVLPVPFPTPSNSEAMAWQAIAHMDFRIVGGYANIADPGHSHGQRQPIPLPPSHVQEMFSYPKLGSMIPWVPAAQAEDQLITYLHRYDIGAVAFLGRGPVTSQGYWYLVNTIGPPQIVRIGFAIWLPTGGNWPTKPVG
jgi:hypothetical protein